MNDFHYILKANEPFDGFAYDIIKDKRQFDSQGGKFKLIDNIEYDQLIAQYCKDLQKPFVEITEERFNEMLNVLPPYKWYRGGNVQYFFMSEFYTYTISRIFVKIGEKYYTALRDIKLSQSEILKEIFDL